MDCITGRKMIPAELGGQHVHRTRCGQRVFVWRRDGRFLARGRTDGRLFGKTLGEEPERSLSELRRLLVQLEENTFVRPSEARLQPLARKAAPAATVIELCNAFLMEKRKQRGRDTAQEYQSRLVPLLEFAESPDVRRRWCNVGRTDREFALQFKVFLQGRVVRANGRLGGAEKPISQRHIHNILDSARMLFSWAKEPEVGRLSISFLNPFTTDIVGERPRKDPLRMVPLPQSVRVSLTKLMDAWQLSHLALSMVLPLRPEDVSGLLISEVDFAAHRLQFGRRFEGHDFTKGKQTFQCPFPRELNRLLKACIGNRRAGPLLQTRSIFHGCRAAEAEVATDEAVMNFVHQCLAQATGRERQTAQDSKRIVRRAIRRMGGVSSDSLAAEFKALLGLLNLSADLRLYDLRASCNTEMDRVHVSPWAQKYVTGHVLTDVQFDYLSFDLDTVLDPYFEFLKPLLNAMEKRADELHL